MTQICLHPDKLLAILDELSRHRALTNEETDMLEAIISRGHVSRNIRFRWTTTIDRALMTAAHSRGGLKRFCERYGVTDGAARVRLHRLRDGMSRKQARIG
jgi:hypothetical protein